MAGMGGGVLPAPSLGGMVAWAPDAVWLAVGVGLAALYAAAVVRLRRRGDRWPAGRLVSWLLGVGVLLAATCTGVASYGMELFSAHMAQHMMLSMLAPIPLLCGAPITLALRALRPARAGHRGPRELLVTLLHSRFARVVSSPFFTLPLFIASLYGLYFTPVFGVLMRTDWGHRLMLAHFLGVGLLFFWPIMGVDPAPHRPGYVLRIVELFAAMPFHAFFGVAVMMTSSLLAPAFAHPPAAWGVSPLADQHTGGALAWAFGELPTLLVLLVVFVGWARSDEREARRRDRAAVRTDDAELAAYNAYLTRLATRSGSTGGGR